MSATPVPSNVHVLGDQICKAIGINPNAVARIVIDIDVRKEGTIPVYVEMYASTKMLDVNWDDCLKNAVIKVLDK